MALATVGSSRTNHNGLPSMSFSASVDQAASILAAPLPSTWTTFHVDIVFSTADATAGDLRHFVQYQWFTAAGGTTINLFGAATTALVTAAPSVTAQTKRVRLLSGVAVDAGKELALMVTRDADNAADTYAGVSHLLEMILTRAS